MVSSPISLFSSLKGSAGKRFSTKIVILVEVVLNSYLVGVSMQVLRFFGVLALLLLSVALIQAGGPSDKAPNFSLKTSEGKAIELEKLKGKVVVVNFWATWCGPCRREIPGFMEVYDQYRSKGLEIVGVSLDRGGWDVVKPYLDKRPITYPIVIGDADLAVAYDVMSVIPITVIVDKKGNIVKRHVGIMFKSDLEAQIKALL